MGDTSQASSLHCGLFLQTGLSLSCKTIGKPTNSMLRAGKKHDKITNRGPCASAQSCSTAAAFFKPQRWSSPCSDFPRLVDLCETFFSLLLLVFSPCPSSEVNTVQIVMSWKWTFPEAGLFPPVGRGPSWKEELSAQSYSVGHSSETFRLPV